MLTTKVPTLHNVINVFMCGGPFSLCTSNVTSKFRFRAISCTNEIGDFKSIFGSSSMVEVSDVQLSGVNGFKIFKALAAASCLAACTVFPVPKNCLEPTCKVIRYGSSGLL